MTIRIKIVPKSTPNADGKWLDVPDGWAENNPAPRGRSWLAACEWLAPLVPTGFVMVEYTTDALR